MYQTAVIFAGGKSSRMGEDKSLMPFGKYSSLTQFQYEKLNKIFKKVYISAKKDKFDFECEIVQDLYPNSSPLIGIISIFEKLDLDELFILSVDAPFVDIKVIEKLYENKDDCDVIIAKSPKGSQPLCGVYKKSILSFAKKQLEENNHRLQSLLNNVDTKYIEFEDEKPFTNLNFLEDYKKAKYKEKHS